MYDVNGKLKLKRIIACLLTALLFLTMLPVSVLADGENLKDELGITTENVTVTEISSENQTILAEAAKERYWGLYAATELDILPGRIHSACHISSTGDPKPQYVTLIMNAPTQTPEPEGDEFPEETTGWVVLALVDGDLVTYPTESMDNENKLRFNIRLGDNGTDFALACLTDASVPVYFTATGDWGTLKLEPGNVEKDDSLGYVRSHQLMFNMSEGVIERLKSGQYLYNFDLTFYLNSAGLKIDAESISFKQDNDLFQLDPELTEKIEEGLYKFTAHVNLEEWQKGNITEVVGISYAAPNTEPLLFEGELQISLPPESPWAGMMACVPLPLTVVEPENTSDTYHKITVTQGENGTIEPHGVEGEVWIKEGADQTFTIIPDSGYKIKDVKVDGQSQGAIDSYIFENVNNDKHTITAEFVPASTVTITPADMTIYMGGEGGYDAVVGEDGAIAPSTNSLPHPLFIVDMPQGSNDDPTDLTFTNGQEGESEKRWTLVCANPDSEGTKYYYFKEGPEQEKVRVTYTDQDGKAHISDSFNPSEVKDVFTTYDIKIYPGDNNPDTIRAKNSAGLEYAVSAGTGTLTVRAVEDTESTSDIVEQSGDTLVPNAKVESGKAVALVPTDTTYTLNGIEGVNIPDDAKPSLLFDNIIASDGQGEAREKALKDAVDEKLGGPDSNRQYEYKYLDLVDAKNGNAWIKASNDVTIYWGYPTGTDENTKFKLVHFKNLHRDTSGGAESGIDPEDIEKANTETINVTTTAQGITFNVKPGNFSPYVLVWEKTSTSHNPGIIPTPDPDPTPTPEPEEPDQPELERDDHYAYIFGYEDNTIRPENDITRAEVATIFYRLLTDESREAYRTTDHDFTDVSADAWHVEPVATLAGAGLLAGYEDGSFRPDAPITRAEYAAIATRFDELAAAESNFTDISGHWAEDAINAAYGAGWVGGYEDGTFRPDQNITRAEAMALINRVLERAVDSEGMLDEMTHWADNDPAAWYYADIQEATHSHTYEREEGEQYETWTDLVPHKVF